MANAHTIVYRNVSVGGNRQKWTLSMWWKFNPKGETYPAGTYYQRLYDAKVDGDFFSIFETGANRLKWYSIGAAEYGIEPKREFRDTVWYHTVLRVDTTSASDLDAADRYRLYVNGVQETEFNWQVNPPQGYEGNTNKSTVDMVHGGATTDNYCWNGVMSHIHMCDGYSYAPTEFGEFDSTSGIWKIKASPSLSYGTNGYWLKFENSSNMDLDSSSNNLTFTTATQAGGGLTLTKDNPSNNFCVLNGAANYGHKGGQLKNGCTTAIQSSTGIHAEGNMGMPAGKWYWEIEMNGTEGDFGVCENGRAYQVAPTNYFPFYFVTNPGTTTTTIYNNARSNPGSSTFTGTAWADGDVAMIAFDADNKNFYFGKNGSWENSGVPTSGATGTGAVITGIESQFGGMIVPFVGSKTASSRTFEFNFGNGYFGLTSHGETNQDDAGQGLFKYDVPAGFYALCTKNIKAYGG